jgi:hypothetical protein
MRRSTPCSTRSNDGQLSVGGGAAPSAGRHARTGPLHGHRMDLHARRIEHGIATAAGAGRAGSGYPTQTQRVRVPPRLSPGSWPSEPAHSSPRSASNWSARPSRSSSTPTGGATFVPISTWMTLTRQRGTSAFDWRPLVVGHRTTTVWPQWRRLVGAHDVVACYSRPEPHRLPHQRQPPRWR